MAIRSVEDGDVCDIAGRGRRSPRRRYDRALSATEIAARDAERSARMAIGSIEDRQNREDRWFLVSELMNQDRPSRPPCSDTMTQGAGVSPQTSASAPQDSDAASQRWRTARALIPSASEATKSMQPFCSELDNSRDPDDSRMILPSLESPCLSA